MSRNHSFQFEKPELQFPRLGTNMTTSPSPTKLIFIRISNQKHYNINTIDLEKAFMAINIPIMRLIMAGDREVKQSVVELQTIEHAITAQKEMHVRYLIRNACQMSAYFITGLTSLVNYVDAEVFYDYSDHSHTRSYLWRRPPLFDESVYISPAAKVSKVKYVNAVTPGAKPTSGCYNKGNPRIKHRGKMNYHQVRMNSHQVGMNPYPVRNPAKINGNPKQPPAVLSGYHQVPTVENVFFL